MHTTATRKVAVLVLTSLMIAQQAVFAFACAITAKDADTGTRFGTAPGSREGT